MELITLSRFLLEDFAEKLYSSLSTCLNITFYISRTSHFADEKFVKTHILIQNKVDRSVCTIMLKCTERDMLFTLKAPSICDKSPNLATILMNVHQVYVFLHGEVYAAIDRKKRVLV